MMRRALVAIALFVIACVASSVACVSSESSDLGKGSAEVVATTSSALSSANIATVVITVTGPNVSTPLVTPLSQSGGTWQGIIGSIPVGADTFTGDAFDSNGNDIYTGTAQVTIVANTQAVVALTLQQKNPPPNYSNTVPIIDSVVFSTGTVAPGGQLTATVTAHDPDGEALTYAWSDSGGALSATNTPSVTWTAPGTSGPQSITIAVSDTAGEQAALSVTVQVGTPNQGSASVSIAVNTWPVISSVAANPTSIDVNQSTNLGAAATDADGDPLSYQWSAGCTGTFDDATIAAPKFTLTSVPANKLCTLTVLVSDGRGGVDTGAITISAGPAPSPTFPPQIVSTFTSAVTVGANTAVTLRVQAADAQGLAMTFAWSDNAGTISGQTDSGGLSTITWTSAACTGGAFVQPLITCTVTDSANLTAVQTFALTSTCPNCSNGTKDGNETGTDCGGGICAACGTGQGCKVASDCLSGVCTGNFCQAPSCNDGVKNGTETGTDCGGASCAPCNPGGGCNVGSDCTSSVCTGNVCQTPSCTDGVKNGTETGTDCGGGTCGPCGTGGGCNSGTDCQSLVCTSNVCVAASCTDGVKNGTETGVDCGGASCAGCAIGGGCNTATDCATPTNGTASCTANQCALASCTFGFYNCDSNDANGCETAASFSHCTPPGGGGAGCGLACTGQQTCQSETCVNPVWASVTALSGTPSSIAIGPNDGVTTPATIYVCLNGVGISSSSDGVTWTAGGGTAACDAVGATATAAQAFSSVSGGGALLTNTSGSTWGATTASPGVLINGWTYVSGVGPIGAANDGSGNGIAVIGQSSGASWVQSAVLGAGSGTSIAYGGGSSPNAVVYVGVNGTGGGVYKSINVGGAFTFASMGFPKTNVSAVAVAPSSLSTVYAGTSGAGMYVSSDGGATWTVINTGLVPKSILAIAVDPTNANNVYAGTSNGVYITKNGGTSWSLSGLGADAITSLAILNGSPNTVYAGAAGGTAGLYVTTTGGQ
jgi:hypothetical protein